MAPAVMTLRCLIILWGALAAIAKGGSEPTPASAVTPDAEPPMGSMWEFRAEPYLWAAGLEGQTGVGALLSDINVPFSRVLENLDIGLLGQIEARRGPVSILLDGMYLKISAEGETPGELCRMGAITQEMAMGELALAFCLVEGKKGFIDILGGVRYNYLGLDASAEVDEDAIGRLSETASGRIIDAAVTKATQLLRDQAAEVVPELQSQVRAVVTQKLQEQWNSLPDPLKRFLQNPRVSDIVKNLAREQAEAAQAVVQEQAAATKRQVQARLQRKVEAARRQLAKALKKEILARLPEDVSADRSWVDPFIGVRAQWSVTDRLSLRVRSDIGGFGIGSDIAWQMQGSLEYKFNRHWFAELGYRHMATDYNRGNFVYDVHQSGFFLGFGRYF